MAEDVAQCLINAVKFETGQELTCKPFSLVSTNRIWLGYGGSKGRPAGNESHSQKWRVIFYGPDWVVMSFEYIDNQVSKEKLAEIDLEAKDSPKAHGLKFFYMRNHYSNLCVSHSVNIWEPRKTQFWISLLHEHSSY